DGALCADARRLCRRRPGGRQRAGHRPAAAAQAAGASRRRPDDAADERLRAASQSRHHASMDVPEGGRMKKYWSLIEPPFQKSAAGVDEGGRLLRFNLRAAGAANVDPEAENNSRKLAEVQRQVTQYADGKRRDFDFELAAEGPEFDKKVWAALLEIPFGTT